MTYASGVDDEIWFARVGQGDRLRVRESLGALAAGWIYSAGSMQVRIFRRRYCSSRKP
jgi:hypothetical protein